VLCQLIPGGVPKAITAAHAAHLLETITPGDAAGVARRELAAAFAEDLRGIGARIREARKKPAAAVAAAGTSLTGLFGAGPVIAAAVIGDVRTVSRFPGRGHFAACDGTAPIEVPSGGRTVCRLSRRGNRRPGHAIHMAAVTQIRHPGSEGRAYYDKKLAEGKTRKEALRALKRRISDAIHARLQAGARRAAAAPGPGGQPGTTLIPARPAHTPDTGSSGKPLPGLATTLRPRPAWTAGPGIPRSLPPRRRRSRRPRCSARSQARMNDLGCGKAAAIPGRGEGQQTTSARQTTASEDHLKRREKDRQHPLTQRGFRSARPDVA
jgi:transposase